MKQVAIYARVSSEQQEKEKTIESQLAELREICKRDGVKIVKEYIDDGWSGATLARPALDQLRDDASKGLFEALYIFSSDRLGRDHIDQGLVLRELKKQGIEINFKDKLLTEDNKLTSDFESLIAEHERRQILERTRRGKLYKAKNKGIVGTLPLYGYDYIPRTKTEEGYYKINFKEAKVVRLILELFIQHQNLYKVGRELEKRGLKSRTGKTWGRWTMSKILSNETYYNGISYFNKTHAIEPKTSKVKKYRKNPKRGWELRNKEEWIPIKVPPILDKGKFDFIQELRARKRRFYSSKKNFYLLSGFLRCGNCHCSLSGETIKTVNGGENKYYKCTNAIHTFPNPPTCRARRIRMKDLNEAVWGQISQAITSPKILLSLISHLGKDDNKNRVLLEEEKKSLIKEKGKIDKKKNKLLELYAEEGIEKKALLEKIGDFSQAEKEMDRNLKEIEARLSQIGNKSIVIKSLQEFCKMTKAQLQTLSQTQKKDLLKALIKEIVYYPDKREAKIVGHIPLPGITEEEKKLEWRETTSQLRTLSEVSISRRPPVLYRLYYSLQTESILLT